MQWFVPGAKLVQRDVQTEIDAVVITFLPQHCQWDEKRSVESTVLSSVWEAPSQQLVQYVKAPSKL